VTYPCDRRVLTDGQYVPLWVAVCVGMVEAVVKHRGAVVVAVVIVWCLALYIEIPRAQFTSLSDVFKGLDAAVNVQMKAVEAVAEAQRQQAATVKAAGENPSPAESATIAKVASEVVTARETLAQVAEVDPKIAADLLAEIDRTYELNRSLAHRYDLVLTVVAGGGIVLSLLAGISNFMSWPKVAGILSLIVAAVVAAPKALPFEANRTLYRTLSAESYGLMVETRYSIDRSPATYKEHVRRLGTLQRYAESPPDAPDLDTVIRSLQTDLKSQSGSPKQPQ
jgi:hypothetical protein